MVHTDKIQLQTSGNCQICDITEEVRESVRRSSVKNGTVTVFVPGSTGAVTTIEYEPGLLRDLPEFLESILPSERTYHHDATWGDGNGHSHLRAALVGPSLSIPIVDGALTLGTWQQVVFVDFDNRARKRRLIAQIVGE